MTSFVPYGTLTFCKNCGEQNPYHRELTDEEITQCLNESMETKNMWGQLMLELNPVNFARAILKKASEK